MCTSDVCPPDTSSATSGGSTSGSANTFAKMCPSRWFTPTSGLPVAIASPFAYATPTTSAPMSPGRVRDRDRVELREVQRPSSPSAAPARSIASSMTPTIASVCLRLAISGTTPPKRAWKSIWLATTLASSSRPPRMTAAAVSSHDDSMARMSSSDSPLGGTALGRRAGLPT